MGGVLSSQQQAGAAQPGEAAAPGTASKVHFAEPVAQDATPASPKPARSSAIKRSTGATRSGRVVKKTGRASGAPMLPPELLAAAAAPSPASARKAKPGRKPGPKPGAKKAVAAAKKAAGSAKRSPGRPPKTPPLPAAAATAVAAAAAAVKSPAARGGISKKSKQAVKHTTPAKRAKQAEKLPKVEKRRVGRPSKAANRK